MAWLDDRLRDHPKIIKASPIAFRHWALALCYCSAHGTEGRLDEAVKALNVPKRIVDELVELRLWDREPDGLWVHDWQEHNDKRDAKVSERREQARLRQQRHRARVRGENPQPSAQRDVTRDGPRDTDRDVTRDTERDSSRARAGAAPRRARDHDQEEPSTAAADVPETPEPSLRDEPDAAAAQTIERLDTIGLMGRVLVADHPLELITAWLDLAQHEALTNPAGFVLTGIRTGQPPSPRIDSDTAKPSLLDKARALHERTRDTEAVADWLAGITRLTPTERETILRQVTT